MQVKAEKCDDKLTVFVSGKLDSVTTPDFETAIKENIGGINCLVFDFGELDYISSAGLRVILGSQKMMNARGGKMTILNAGEEVVNVFKVTGMISIFNLE